MVTYSTSKSSIIKIWLYVLTRLVVNMKRIRLEKGIVKLQLAGACAGCPSSSVTLKSGVENMLKHYIPEVQGIEEVNDAELEELNKKEFKTFEEKLRAAGVPSV